MKVDLVISGEPVRTIDLGEHPSKLALRRWRGELSPEPETVQWIESLPRNQGKRFYDIGASVGTHAIRAHYCGLSVTAFEPYEPVYNDLCAVVDRNAIPILCSQLAFSDVVTDGRMAPGRSTATFYPDRQEGQPARSTTLGQYCFMHGPPDYIKLDVDGNEEAIVRGGETLLKSGRVQSLLIEVDPVVSPNLPSMMRELGYSWDKQQVEQCMIREGKYKGTANYIFFR